MTHFLFKNGVQFNDINIWQDLELAKTLLRPGSLFMEDFDSAR